MRTPSPYAVVLTAALLGLTACMTTEPIDYMVAVSAGEYGAIDRPSGLSVAGYVDRHDIRHDRPGTAHLNGDGSITFRPGDGSLAETRVPRSDVRKILVYKPSTASAIGLTVLIGALVVGTAALSLTVSGGDTWTRSR